MLLLLAACAPPPPLVAREGELLYAQLGLSGGSIGQSALIVGSDGTTVLIDVGNDAHDDEVADALAAVGSPDRVDWVVLTHLHADHVGGLDDLARRVEIGGLIWRGPVDVGDDANAAELAEICELPATWLCGGTCEAPSAGGDCAGLDAGDLTDPDDTGPAFLPIGDARLALIGVNGAFGEERIALPDDENARSLVAALTRDDFTLLLAGDLTGGGKGTPDVESFVAPRVPPADVLVLSHHGIRSSSNEAWLDAALPGGTRSALVGANDPYLAAPHQDVVDAVSPRLGEGFVWVTQGGVLAGEGDRVRVADGTVEVRVGSGTYTVAGGGWEERYPTR